MASKFPMEPTEQEKREDSDDIVEDACNGNTEKPFIQLKLNQLLKMREMAKKHLAECGWRNEIRKRIERGLVGRTVGSINYGELAAAIVPVAGSLVPTALCDELTEYTLTALQTDEPLESGD